MEKFIVMMLNWPVVVLAGTDPSQLAIKNPIKAENFTDLLEAILSVVVQLGVPIVTLMIIFTGFKFVMARGNQSKLTEAKTALWYTILGALIVLGAYAIEAIIESTVGTITGA